jgi:hypothetical protein
MGIYNLFSQLAYLQAYKDLENWSLLVTNEGDEMMLDHEKHRAQEN